MDYLFYLISEIEDYDLIVPTHAKGKEPLIAFYNKTCLPAIEEKLQGGDFKMHNLLQLLNTKFVDSQKWVDKYPKLFHNLNRPEDL